MPLSNLDPADNFVVVETKIDAAIDAINALPASYVTPDTGTAALKVKVVQIGDWNMDTTATVSVAHGLPDYKKIRDIGVVVRADGDDLYSASPWLDAASVGNPVLLDHNIDGTTSISIVRATGSFFDSVSYDSTPFNRGFITIIYEG